MGQDLSIEIGYFAHTSQREMRKTTALRRKSLAGVHKAVDSAFGKEAQREHKGFLWSSMVFLTTTGVQYGTILFLARVPVECLDSWKDTSTVRQFGGLGSLVPVYYSAVLCPLLLVLPPSTAVRVPRDYFLT